MTSIVGVRPLRRATQRDNRQMFAIGVELKIQLQPFAGPTTDEDARSSGRRAGWATGPDADRQFLRFLLARSQPAAVQSRQAFFPSGSGYFRSVLAPGRTFPGLVKESCHVRRCGL